MRIGTLNPPRVSSTTVVEPRPVGNPAPATAPLPAAPLPPHASAPADQGGARRHGALDLQVGALRLGRDAARLPKVLDEAIAWARLAPLSTLTAEQLAAFTRAMPKVDLHRHLEGAITPERLLATARRYGIELPCTDLDGLRPCVQITPTDKTLLDFIAKFDTIGKVFKSGDVIADLTAGVIADAAVDHVKHLELRFSPLYMAQAHNLDLDDVVRGVLRGVKAAARADVTVRLILIVERQLGLEPAATVVELAEKYQDRGVVALDLANDEQHYPPGPYAEIFRRAKKAGLSITVHAGEAAGAENVDVSVRELGADRIGHGVHTRDNPDTVELVRRQGTVLELCPTSNVQTGAVATLEQHPLREYFDAGIGVTVNTDDPAISGTTLSAELEQVIREFGFNLEELHRLVATSVDGAFLPDSARDGLRAEVGQGLAAAEQALFANLSVQQLFELAAAGMRARGLPEAGIGALRARLARLR